MARYRGELRRVVDEQEALTRVRLTELIAEG